MPATESEFVAARQLGESLLKFILAFEEGAEQRQRLLASVIAVRSIAETKSTSASESNKTPQRDRRSEPDSLLLTLLEAAKLLRVSDRHLRKMSHPTGPIPVVRIGGRLLYSRKDLETAIDFFRST